MRAAALSCCANDVGQSRRAAGLTARMNQTTIQDQREFVIWDWHEGERVDRLVEVGE